MDWAGAAAALGILLTPLGAVAGAFYLVLSTRIKALERENREYLKIILSQSGESKETREALLKVIERKASETDKES